MLAASRAAAAPRSVHAALGVAARAASSSGPSTAAAEASTRRPDFLLNFKTFSASREVYHYTTYAMAAGIPAALIFGAPVSTLVDLTLGVAVPLHAHMGVRSVLVDYVHDPITQQLTLAILAGVTVLTALGLTKFNLMDVGITEGVKQVFVEQPAPKGKPAAGTAAAQLH